MGSSNQSMCQHVGAMHTMVHCRPELPRKPKAKPMNIGPVSTRPRKGKRYSWLLRRLRTEVYRRFGFVDGAEPKPPVSSHMLHWRPKLPTQIFILLPNASLKSGAVPIRTCSLAISHRGAHPEHLSPKMLLVTGHFLFRHATPQ